LSFPVDFLGKANREMIVFILIKELSLVRGYLNSPRESMFVIN